MTDLIQTIAKALRNVDARCGGVSMADPDAPPPAYYADRANVALNTLHDAGYAIVPREPTKAVQEAGQRAKEADPYPANAQIYRAMIRAAITTGERNG